MVPYLTKGVSSTKEKITERLDESSVVLFLVKYKDYLTPVFMLTT